MASIEEHSGYRPPAASDQAAAPAPAGDPSPAPSRAAERDAHAHHRASAVAHPEGSAPPAAHSPSRFLADLVEAMLATATEARTTALDQARNDAKHAVETIHVQSADEADGLRRRADDDIAGIQAWAKAEMQRIREEAEQRISVRKDALGTELDVHAAEIEHRIEIVQRRVTAFESEMEAFFAGLASASDPTTIALMAERMPESPRFDVAPEDLEAEVAVAEGHILEIVQATTAEQSGTAEDLEATATAGTLETEPAAPEVAAATSAVEAGDADPMPALAQADEPVGVTLDTVEAFGATAPAEVVEEPAPDAGPAAHTDIVEDPSVDGEPKMEGVSKRDADGPAAGIATVEAVTDAVDAPADVAPADVAPADVVPEDAASEDRAMPEVHGSGEERRLLRQAISRPMYGPELPADLPQDGASIDAAAAAPELEPAAPEPPAQDGVEEAGATRLAARLARLSGFSATRAQPAVPGIAPLATSRVSVSGLVSVAGIASFKRHLSTLVGVRSVSVNSSHDGGFLFSVEHEPSLQLAMLVTRFPGFTARIVSAEGDSIVVVAHDPTIDG